MNLKRALGLLAAACLLPALALAAPAADGGLPPFSARYTLAFSGLTIGEAVVRLERDGEHYRMLSTASAKGPFAMMVPDRLREEAEGRFSADGPLPDRYLHERSGGKDEELTRIRFDRQAGKVYVLDDGRQAELELRPQMVDPLGLQLLVMWRLRSGQPLGSVELVDDATPSQYTVSEKGHETVQTGLGALDAVRLDRGQPGDKKVLRLWFSPRLGWLPVQIVQLRKGRETLRMTLLDAHGVPDP